MIWRNTALLLADFDPQMLCCLQGGNNNTYCHDSPLNWFNWDQAAADTKGFARYFQCLVHFRCSTPSAQTL